VKSRRQRTWILILVVMAFSVSLNAWAAQPVFSDWPEGLSLAEVGKRVAERFVISPHLDDAGPIQYPEVVAWYGALSFAQVTGDKELSQKLIRRFDPLLDSANPQVPTMRHVDFSVFGTVPLEIYIETKDPKYLEFGRGYADRQWENPDSNGLSPQTRFWIDDMYMIIILQLEAYRATGDGKYIDRAAVEMTAYLEKLQQPNGLFYHAPDVPIFWGRGDGWVAAGMAEILRSLPQDNPRRGFILERYRKMMQVLVKFQGKDGMWRQVMDDEAAWPETSSTGMFTFAMVTGVKNGWLNEKVYGEAARRAWIGLVGYVDQNADVTNVCVGTQKKNDHNYYLMRKRRTGDFHGSAALLWTATALLR
jgi:unsaturated rhamnogalacturonyl hydrolase